ncbi:MAG: hypothetical protein ACKVS9_10220 [Phycisphaerae bacterium]
MPKQNDPKHRDRSGLVLGLVLVVFGLIGLATSGAVFLLADSLGRYPHPNRQPTSTTKSLLPLGGFGIISALAIAGGVVLISRDAKRCRARE